MRVTVHVDGGARGNPGPAAVAAVATSADGDALGERNAYIGEATNNVAEYRALLLGLELARDLGATEVEVVNDSELVARQIGGEYKVKHAGLKPLYADAMRSLRDFDGWAVRAVRREENSRADELVNELQDLTKKLLGYWTTRWPAETPAGGRPRSVSERRASLTSQR